MSSKRIQKLLSRLKSDNSGNAMLLMAFGMPVLIGTSGMAVDFAQWYMWKRELQYAVDQAAIAGAWARAEPASAASYQDRAKQEFSSNVSMLKGITTTPVVGLANYGTGTQNSVTVSSSASKSLPFSQMVMKSSVTVRASAKATFEAATNWTTCVLALDPTSSDSLIIGGTASGDVSCGMGALSNAAQAIRKNGNPSLKVSDIIAAGGIDAGLKSNGTIHPFISNLSDPYSELTPPSSPTARSYVCPSSATSTTVGTTTADITTTTVRSYTYWQGKNKNQATAKITYSGPGASTDSSSSSVSFAQTVPITTKDGDKKEISNTESWTGKSWAASGSKETLYEKLTVVVTDSYSNVKAPITAPIPSGTADNLLPGTYSNISVTCPTHFSPGVYIVTGTLDFGQNLPVTGSDVMFVLTGSGTEKFKLNSKSTVVMSGITEGTLMSSYGLSEKQARALAGMLIFDPNSTADVQINGSATMIMEGVVYIPKRKAKFNGNSSVTGKCMMLAAGKLEFTGTNDLASFCIPPDLKSFDIGGSTISIRLVA